MRRILLFFGLFSLAWNPSNCGADDGTTIRAGRPGQAIGSYTVGERILQFQSGAQFERASYSLASVIRYGVSEKVEINTGWGWRAAYSPTEQRGVDPSFIGARFDVLSQGDWTPALGIQTSLKLNAFRGTLGTAQPASKFLLVLSKELASNFTLDLNLGPEWDGITPPPFWNYVINASLVLNTRVSVFAENYGLLSVDGLRTYFDGGLAYLASPDLQLDLYGGIAKNGGVLEYFLSAGVSFRLNLGPSREKG